MEPLVGQIILFAGTFAPRGWALCDGQTLPIDRYPQLFSLLGTAYGGDGQTTFALPDLRGRVPLHAGAGPGLTPRRQGEVLGAETIALGLSEMPAHGHDLLATDRPADADRPGGAMLARGECYARKARPPEPPEMLAAASIAVAGEGLPHENMPPALCLSFIIAIEGRYPARGPAPG
ncbi:phage tail protein [Paracoccus marinaquae]|uniref:Tail fiber protein n=1 Tax=Paracoccus marinaquae TaxID=2841926 RepID=A0ABS6AF00_9RHOB|nr:tail fiber protein [Paracoccus marinaquae]MBU3029103.1 tail fiber protein [Paracoccus marinaquae]